jgi:hypothetical protein
MQRVSFFLEETHESVPRTGALVSRLGQVCHLQKDPRLVSAGLQAYLNRDRLRRRLR